MFHRNRKPLRRHGASRKSYLIACFKRDVKQSCSPLFELARVLVRLDHVASLIENANDSVPVNGTENLLTRKTCPQSERPIISFSSRTRAVRGNPANVVTHSVPSPARRGRCPVPSLASLASQGRQRMPGGTVEQCRLQTHIAATEFESTIESVALLMPVFR